MKLIRWMEQHIRGSRKKDKEEKEKQNKKNRKLQRSFDEVGSVAKLQGNELQNAVREQTTLTVESLLGPLYTAGEPTIAKTENNLKGNHHCDVAFESSTHHYAFEGSQRTEGEVYSEIPDTPPPPAPPSIANRIPLQHIRCIGQTAPSAVNDAAIQAQQCNSETPKERTRIKTNPWFVSSPQSPCCSSSTSGDSGAWTATSSDRSGRTIHTQEGQTPVENANHDWYYAESSSSTASLSKKVPMGRASQLYQNVMPLEDQQLNSRMAGGKRVLYRYPSGTHLSSAGHPTPWQFHKRPESARTYRKSYFMNHYGDDPADCTSSEDEAFSDDYQLGSVTSHLPSARRRSDHVLGEFDSPSSSTNDVVERLCNRGTPRQRLPSCRGGQLQFPYTPGISEKQREGYRLGSSSGLKTPRPKDEYGRPPLKTVENQIRQQENFLLHRELLQFKQFLLMRTLENMGSEINMSRNALFSSPQLRPRVLLERHDLYGLSPRIGQRQQLPTGQVAAMGESRLPPRQPCRPVPHHQSPRLVSKLTRSPLKDPRARNPQMSPRTPRLARARAYPQDAASQITQSTQIPHHEKSFDCIEHPRSAPFYNNPKLPCSPKVGMKLDPVANPATPLMGRPLYAKPKGVPRTTTIDFQAFASPSRKQTGEMA